MNSLLSTGYFQYHKLIILSPKINNALISSNGQSSIYSCFTQARIQSCSMKVNAEYMVIMDYKSLLIKKQQGFLWSLNVMELLKK